MKKKISKEIKIGISFIISIFILYFGISFLKGVNIFKPSNTYIVVFEDVTDLTLSSPVLLNGYQVGLVYSMEIDKNNPQRVVTTLNVGKGLKIPKGSEIKLDISLLGSASVVIKPNYEEKTLFYASTDTIKGIKETGMLESVSKNLVPQVSGLVPKLDSILVSINTMLSNPSLSRSLENVESSTRQLNVLLTSVNRDIPAITSNMIAVSQDLSDITKQAKTIDLQSAYNSVDSTLKNIQLLTDKINSKDNSIGILLNDRQLYDSIASTLNNASLLLKDIKENPSRYINVKVF